MKILCLLIMYLNSGEQDQDTFSGARLGNPLDEKVINTIDSSVDIC